jgi:hypothetical protein
MTSLGRDLLAKLLREAEKGKAVIRLRKAAITRSALELYHSSSSIQDRETFEAIMQAAQDNGAVRLTRERGYGVDGRIERVDLVDLEKLAAFIGVPTREGLLFNAKVVLSEVVKDFQILNEVLEGWRQLKNVRGTSPEDVQDWIDAVRVIQYMRDQDEARIGELPIREVSAHIFKDSKRIEKLVGTLDVLLCGSIDSTSRDQCEVWLEIGLRREEQPVRLAGNVTIRRKRVHALLDVPYAAFPASTVCGVDGFPSAVISIENQTTFHTEARRRCEDNVLLIYTAGMPSPAWRAMYARILKSVPKSTAIEHWGDIDEGGFRIASVLAELAKECGHILKPHRMAPGDVPLEKRRPAAEKTRSRMRLFAEKAGWAQLASEIFEAGFTVEQEAL